MFNPKMEQTLQKIVQRNAKAAAAHKGYKQPQLIARGMSAGSVHRVMTGQNLTFDVLERLAKALGVPAWHLLLPTYDAANPPAMLSSEQIEDEVQRRLREKLEPLSDLIGGLSEQGSENRQDGRSAAKPYLDSPVEGVKQKESRPATAKRKQRAR